MRTIEVPEPAQAANAARMFEAAEQQFATVFENAPIGMSLVGLDLQRLRVNRAFCTMLGYSQQELLELPVYRITHPDDWAAADAERAGLLAGKKDAYEREQRYIHKDGRVLWGRVSCSLVRDADRRPLYFIAQVQDVTERRAAEQALRASELRLRDTQALLHMAAQIGRLGAWSWTVGDARVFWSEEVCSIHEVRSGFAPTPQQALAFFAPHERARFRQALDACIRDGTPFDLEAQVVTNRGRTLWTRVIAEAEWDAGGRVRCIQGACQDISEAKRTAEQNRKMAEQLTATLESLTDAFFTIDASSCFTYVNAEAERLLRRSRMYLLGRNAYEVLPELRGSSVAAMLERSMREHAVVQQEFEYAPLGIWVHVKMFPSHQGVAVYVRDVTERVRAQREILRLNAELEERVRQRTAQLEAANRELEAFSYSIAHDLRAPLGSIDGFAHFLEESAGDALPPRSRHYLSRMRAGVRQMGEITDGLLALANFSRAPLRCEPVDLADIARSTVAALREREPQREVAVEIPARLPAVGDPRLLQQALGNLLGNAWKFTARVDAARIELGTETSAAGETVFYVRDNGAGFDMSHAARMFEAFQRLHSPSEYEGTGVGLAIVHRIVTRHGGRIWAQAAPGEGAVFRFTLGAATA